MRPISSGQSPCDLLNAVILSRIPLSEASSKTKNKFHNNKKRKKQTNSIIRLQDGRISHLPHSHRASHSQKKVAPVKGEALGPLLGTGSGGFFRKKKPHRRRFGLDDGTRQLRTHNPNPGPIPSLALTPASSNLLHQ